MCYLIITKDFRNLYDGSKYYAALFDEVYDDFDDFGVIEISATDIKQVEWDITHYITVKTNVATVRKRVVFYDVVQKGGTVIYDGTRYNKVRELMKTLVGLPEFL